ncbi:hypothetical protein ABIC78_004058 [Novosphingobium sp. 1529]|uniref:hypothetical protein n=1 Tax=Novosphingobium TaxID=165696 RepID=UPI0007890591|nr:hypothetical protein [Novosphingobium capsulatum]WQD93171.1 hypothetical protein U0041_00790 [Novosphingobium capsulatum]
MRADAKVLLDRLGKSDFRYREFVDRFADLESWPIFEALLKDPRIMPQDDASAIAATMPGDSGRLPAPRAQARPEIRPEARAEARPEQAPVAAAMTPAERVAEPVAAPVAVAPSDPVPLPTKPAATPSLFGRYGRPDRAQNIRSLLQRLSDAVEGGDA